MESSSSSFPAPALSSDQSWNHDVFLSFRGEDTRRTFVDHLYSALVQQGICTYKDDENLPRGKSIGPSLKEAIRESHIAVIVFSKNYANSSWCLDELEYIMECKDTRGQIVLPIFYDVDPSEVRKQKRKYGEAFAKHELENKNKVESWRKALVDASNISGWEPKHIANGHESEGIKQIVVDISQKVQLVTSSTNENLIGIVARMQHLKSELQIGSGGVHMIGIWGVGGGGKTTLASSIYDEISNNFDGSCFVENIREESSKYGLIKLQEKIVSELDVHRVGGRMLISIRLRHKKVLIVLDDVDHLDQLKALAGSRDWFGEGSRIIITTRDKHILTAHRVNVIHNISLLNEDEGIKLFCKHAPRDYRPVEDYEFLSKEVVSYAGGLPLAITVLGCFLCDKEMNEWRSALARLKEIPDADIMEKLKISFDGLKSVEKELFLEIACFFSGKYKNDLAMTILDVCGFHPIIGIKVLIQKALITISDGKFDMHDLVQEMGQYIVRGEHPKKPEKHNRVCKKEDVLKICTMDATTNLDKIEAITFQCHLEDDELHRFLQVVAGMKKLRWIDLEVQDQSFWTVDSDNKERVEITRPLPENFPPKNLRCLTLSGIVQKQLWKGYKYLPNLIVIKLAGLENLIKTPDFDGLPNLQRFMVNRSMCLEEIHQSVGHLKKLVYVEIECCFNLTIFPPIIESNKLETLIISGCPRVFNSLKIQQRVVNLENLHSDINHIWLSFFHRGLTKLNLSRCNLEDPDLNRYVFELSNLEELSLGGNNFSRLSFSGLQLPRLKWLNVSFCEKLVKLLDLPSSIAILLAINCGSLEIVDIRNCNCLWKVLLSGRNKLSLLDGDKLLRSMLQGNVKHHFICASLSNIDIWKGFVARLDRGETFTSQLPHDWYDDYSGILMFIKSNRQYPYVNIIIKHGRDQDYPSEVWQVPDERRSTPSDYETCVGYVSFSSLRHTGCFNSTYNMISYSLGYGECTGIGVCSFTVALVPRKSEDDPRQTTKFATDFSECWDEQADQYRKTFTIGHDSKSSIKILWNPFNYTNPLAQVFPTRSKSLPSNVSFASLALNSLN